MKIVLPSFPPIRGIPFLEISKWSQIYCIEYQITSLNKISDYLMRKLKSITITCPFNKIISLLRFFSMIEIAT